MFTESRTFEKPSKSFKNVVVLPFYPKVSFQIAKILKSFNFSIVFSPVNKSLILKITLTASIAGASTKYLVSVAYRISVKQSAL